jgi:hypothetical protein
MKRFNAGTSLSFQDHPATRFAIAHLGWCAVVAQGPQSRRYEALKAHSGDSREGGEPIDEYDSTALPHADDTITLLCRGITLKSGVEGRAVVPQQRRVGNDCDHARTQTLTILTQARCAV